MVLWELLRSNSYEPAKIRAEHTEKEHKDAILDWNVYSSDKFAFRTREPHQELHKPVWYSINSHFKPQATQSSTVHLVWISWGIKTEQERLDKQDQDVNDLLDYVPKDTKMLHYPKWKRDQKQKWVSVVFLIFPGLSQHRLSFK